MDCTFDRVSGCIVRVRWLLDATKFVLAGSGDDAKRLARKRGKSGSITHPI